jgi:hypothetical protein
MVLNELRRIQKGWSVIGSNGRQIGTVAQVRDDQLVVEAGLLQKHDLYVPVSAVSQVGDDRVTVNATADEAEQLGWRYPPEQGYARRQDLRPTGEGSDTTTLTGAAYGAGAGVSSAGPVAPGHGDAIADRLGGSGRAGLSGLSARPDDDQEPREALDAYPRADAGDADGDADDARAERRDDDADDAPPLT